MSVEYPYQGMSTSLSDVDISQRRQHLAVTSISLSDVDISQDLKGTTKKLSRPPAA